MLQEGHHAPDASPGSMSPSSLHTGMHVQRASIGGSSMLSGRGVEPSGLILPQSSTHVPGAAADVAVQPPGQRVEIQQLGLRPVSSNAVSSGAGQDAEVVVPVATSELTLYQQRVRSDLYLYRA